MALTERTRIREVLIVQDDTTLEWRAHQVPITEILSGGVIVAAKYDGPQALKTADIGKVLQPAFIAITNERDALKARVAELEAELSKLSTKQ